MFGMKLLIHSQICMRGIFAIQGFIPMITSPDNKVHVANMGPIWGRQYPVGPHVGPMNLAIWVNIMKWDTGKVLFRLKYHVHSCQVSPQLGWGTPVNYECYSTVLTTVLTKQRSRSQTEILINSFWPSYSVWRHRTGSTLAQAMDWCLDGTEPISPNHLEIGWVAPIPRSVVPLKFHLK